MIASVGKEVWTRLWNRALDLGHKYTRGLQNLTRLMAHHGRVEKPCPLCPVILNRNKEGHQSEVLEHVLAVHSERLGQKFIMAEVLSRLKETDINFLCYFGICLAKIS